MRFLNVWAIFVLAFALSACNEEGADQRQEQQVSSSETDQTAFSEVSESLEPSDEPINAVPSPKKVLRASLGSRNALSEDLPVTPETGAQWQDYSRAETYSSVARLPNQQITMRDGTKLFVKVALPGIRDDQPAQGPFPVLLTQTAYNASVGPLIPALGGANAFLVKRGYASVVVDVRGTGNSGGSWEAFGELEQADYDEVVNWIVEQPWSNGSIGVQGVSYLAITAMLTAEQQNPAVKAAFPIVPIGDGYRDVIFTGGNLNATFTPLWMAAVTSLGMFTPELLAEDPEAALQILPNRLKDLLLGFQVPTILKSVLGDEETVYDGEFWGIRSPLEHADKIQVPTFVVGGLYDIFQRSEPLWYEKLKGQVPVKLLIGPWTHIEAAGVPGTGLPRDGVPDINHLQLQWFDEYLMGLDTHVEQQPNVTQYVIGHERYEVTSDWPHPDMKPERLFLQADHSLGTQAPEQTTTFKKLQQPLNGLCSFSTTQWTAGITGLLPLPCVHSNGLSELNAIKFEYPSSDKGYYLNGPMQADLWVSTTARDVQLSVRVDLVAPSGLSEPISNGLLTASMNSVDESRSRIIDGEMLQPWHTFQEGDSNPLTGSTPRKMSVEIFPSSVFVPPGYSLRVSLNSGNVAQGLPPLLKLLDSIGGLLTLHVGPETPSSLVVPRVPEGVLSNR
ncbi:MAG: CocE/NonD family hydrolase [Marinobacter sp.]